MEGNATIPTPSDHDAHYAPRCICCGEILGDKIGGEVKHCGEWGDACEACYAMLKQHEAGDMKSGIELIAEERERQISREGWTAEHDSRYQSGELNDAAICYASAVAEMQRGNASLGLIKLHINDYSSVPWPWEDEWWKPSDDPKRNLIKAGALIAAEIDRLQRLEETK